MEAVNAEAIGVNENGKAFDLERYANEMFAKKPNWVLFFREIFGPDGAVVKTVKLECQQDYDEWAKTPTYAKLQQMVATLREESHDKDDRKYEPTTVITVRLPKSVHLSLKQQAETMDISMNNLCVSKLLRHYPG